MRRRQPGAAKPIEDCLLPSWGNNMGKQVTEMYGCNR
jgi:hypothetical protein